MITIDAHLLSAPTFCEDSNQIICRFRQTDLKKTARLPDAFTVMFDADDHPSICDALKSAPPEETVSLTLYPFPAHMPSRRYLAQAAQSFSIQIQRIAHLTTNRH